MDSVLRAAAIYLVLMIVFKIAGRRSLAELTTFDLVLLMVIGEATQQALLGDDFLLTNVVLVIVTLIAIDIGFSLVKPRSRWFSRSWMADRRSWSKTAKYSLGASSMRGWQRSRTAHCRTRTGMLHRGRVRHKPRQHLTMREVSSHSLLLLISDGKPNDIDQYKGRYGVEDMRQAVTEADLQSVYSFCLTIDRQAANYPPAVFGASIRFIAQTRVVARRVAEVDRKAGDGLSFHNSPSLWRILLCLKTRPHRRLLHNNFR